MIPDKDISIHNLSARNFILSRIETFSKPSTDSNIKRSCFVNIVRFLTKLTKKNKLNLQKGVSDEKSNTNNILAPDCITTIPPFSTKGINCSLDGSAFQGELRLILEDHEGNSATCKVQPVQRHTTIRPTAHGETCEPYYCIRHPTAHLLTIIPNLNYHEWMSDIPDDTALSSISIPGTHNSTTYHRALPSVRCQAVSVTEQLNNGIRFLDIRLQVSRNRDDGKLTLVHGAFPISLTGTKDFGVLLKEIYGFLEAHPSEAVIMSLKREGVVKATDEHLARVLHKHHIDSSRWFDEPRVPTLAEARGRIVLMRRFALPRDLSGLRDGRGWGIDAEDWTYNSPDCVHGDVRVQDFCEVLRPSQVEEKIGYCCAHFARTAALTSADKAKSSSPSSSSFSSSLSPSTPPLYLNFLSGSNFWRLACWPEKISAKLNPAALAFLCEKYGASSEDAKPAVTGLGAVGTVVCDWVGENGDWDLVKCIIATNSHLLGASEKNGRPS